MAEEQSQEVTPVENNAEVDALKENIKGLERKNHELIGKIQKAKQIPVSYTHLTMPTKRIV